MWRILLGAQEDVSKHIKNAGVTGRNDIDYLLMLFIPPVADCTNSGAYPLIVVRVSFRPFFEEVIPASMPLERLTKPRMSFFDQ